MGDREGPQPSGGGPAPLAGPGRLTRGERLRVVAAALAPIPVVAVVLVPVAAVLGAGAGEVAGAALVYGGLLGLASGFVAVDRFHARQCPRCRARPPRDAERCPACDHDLVARPRFACSERHRTYVEPGLCACGRRLQRLDAVRGVRREVLFTLRVGGWLLAFLIGMGLLLRFAA